MKKTLILGLLILCSLTFLAGCNSSKKEKKSKETKVSEEFYLKKAEKIEGAKRLDNILFSSLVIRTKVKSFSHDSSGTSLGYTLDERETEKFIKILQEGEIKGVEVDSEAYSNAIKSSIYGYVVDFTDSFDKHYEGVARITCVTATDTYFISFLNSNRSSYVYKVELDDSQIAYLNKKAEENYQENNGNPNWFNKAFKK